MPQLQKPEYKFGREPNEKIFFLLVIIAGFSYIIIPNAQAVTVYPGTIIGNSITNYTADVHPNFNVSSITVNSTHIFLGSTYYDIVKPATQVNANITGFHEGINFTIHDKNPTLTATEMNVLGFLQQVKLGTHYYPYGTIWRYVLGTYTQIDVNNRDVFGSFTAGNVTVNSLTLTGVLQQFTTVFGAPRINVASPSLTYVTEIGLFNSTSLLDVHVFSTWIPVTANTYTSIPWQFNDTRLSGTQTYNVEAVLTDNSTFTIATSNNINILYGNFTLGHMDLNFTNPNKIPIRFNETRLNSTTDRLGVIYQNGMNMECNFYFQFAMTNHTYGPPLIGSPINSHERQYDFFFINMTNDIGNVHCMDTITKTNGTYLLTQPPTDVPFVQLLKNFRNGTYGTYGGFGALDLITLLVIIIGMIGLNRVNDAAGVIFAVMVLGSFSYFGIIEWPALFFGALAIATVTGVITVRKIIGG